MGALLFSDWCTVRGTFGRVLVACLLIACPLTLMTTTEGEVAPGIFPATIVTIIIVFYAMLGLFGADEQLGWEGARLALPFTTRLVVRARYAFLALCTLASALMGLLSGIVANALLPAASSLGMPQATLQVAGTVAGVATGGLAYLGLFMPIIFKVGISKSRMFFSAALLLPLLFNIEPVRQAVWGVIGWLQAMSAAVGSPIPLVLAWLALCVTLYLASMLVSERLYAARDF